MTECDRVPEGWGKRRLRFDASLNPNKSSINISGETEISFVPMDSVGEFGGLGLSERRELASVYEGYTYFADHDVCIAKITPCFENGKGALAEGLTSGIAFGTTELHIVRAHSTLDERFLFYVTIAHDFRSYGASEMLGAGGQKRVPENFIKDWRILLPPIDTQRRIVRFLDEKTARVDALIEKKLALLDRLTEKGLAIITQAATKGINPAATMKNSKLDWLGQIPAHWGLRGLTKCVTRIDYRGATPPKARSGVFLVTARNIKNGKIDYERSKEFIEEDDYQYVMRRGKPSIGDVLFTTEAPLGEIACVDREDIALAQRIIKFTSSIPDLNNYYLAYWMQTLPFLFDLRSRATGSTAPGIKASKIVDLRCLLPPISEQSQIVSYLDNDRAYRDTIRQEISKSIRILEEFRTAVVTAAVTGKIADLK